MNACRGQFIDTELVRLYENLICNRLTVLTDMQNTKALIRIRIVLHNAPHFNAHLTANISREEKLQLFLKYLRRQF